MYIAVVQTDPKLGALKQNAERALAHIDELASRPYPPDLVIFPAFALSGAPLEGLGYSAAFAADVLAISRDFMSRVKLPTLIGSVLPRPIIDTLSFICEPEILLCREGRGGALGFVDFSGSWDENRLAQSVNLVLDGVSITIILDSFPEPTDDLSGSDLIIMMLAKAYQGPDYSFTSSNQLNLLKGIAKRWSSNIVVANLAGAQDGEVFDGASVVVDATGTVIKSCEPFVEQVIDCNLPIGFLSQKSQSLGSERRSVDLPVIKPMLPAEAEWRALKAALSGFVAKNDFKGFVLELRTDSASNILAALAADTLGCESVHCLCWHDVGVGNEGMDRAIEFVTSLGIKPLNLWRPAEVPAVFERDMLPPLDAARFAERQRMSYVLGYAEANNLVSLSSVDKTALALGLTTAFGDAAGLLAPFATLYRSDVHRLYEWRAEQCMWDQRSDWESEHLLDLQLEPSTPAQEFSLALIDAILSQHIEDGLGVDQILEASRDNLSNQRAEREELEALLEMVKQAEVKRRQAPITPFLGYKDLFLDRAWPVTNGFHDHLRLASVDDDLLHYLGLLEDWRHPDDWSFMSN